MAGEAKTNNFMLGSATVMLGTQAEMWDLNPAEHSIGLVKGFTMTSEPGYTDLTQGVKNSIVYSVMTSNTVKAQMEVYEYTAKNLSYALGLDGGALSASTVSSLIDASVSQAATAVDVTAGDGANFTVGDWVTIQDGTEDKAWVRQLIAISTDELSFAEALPLAIPAGGSVRKVNAVDIGSKDTQPFFAAKIVGTVANGDEVVIMIPKMRITNGFTLGFVTDNFGNMPFEFTVFDLVASDANYAKFPNRQALILTDG